jgi:hypothetical protein
MLTVAQEVNQQLSGGAGLCCALFEQFTEVRILAEKFLYRKHQTPRQRSRDRS